MGDGRKQTRSSKPVEPPVNEYAAFVGQLELVDVWLRSVHVANAHGPSTPDQIAIQIESGADWTRTDTGFRALQTYRLRFSGTDTLYATLDVEFGLDFDSADSMTAEFFVPFSEFNLPLNTWPYLRELVATATGRMGWAVATLPTYKVGTRSLARPTPASNVPTGAGGSTSPKARRARRSKPPTSKRDIASQGRSAS